ncbi:MAG: EAL domain-containing protein [Lachnospiraceae bacterium]|nr:EAL domain-containing protein [Lachnospiraceae bacterium]
MTHKEKADTLLRQQYHCSQALFGAFAEDFDIDLKTAFKVSTCFGAGMRQGEVCGCISASLMILGMAFGFYNAQNRELEMYGNKKTREFIDEFKKRMCGDTLCRDILAQDIKTAEGQKIIKQAGLILKKCPRAINHSIDILEEMLAEHDREMAENAAMMAEYEQEMQDLQREKQEAAALMKESGRTDADKWNLEKFADHDEVQDVMKRNNRKYRFRRNVGELVYSSRKPIAFIQFDIRRFKIINDLYGERFGDEILYFIIDQLKSICNEKQYYLNPRSDVFMIVTEYETEEDLMAFIHKVDDNISSFKNVRLQLSYGVYSVEDKNMELRQMEDRAAMARKAAKNNVVTNILFYKEQFKELLYSRKFIEESMQTAIADHQFKMYLQPKFSITKNQIVGAEALVRWIHPERGMIYPNEFIPAIEENGFIKEVDYFIWSEAAAFIRQCAEMGVTDCPVSVNVSRVHLQDDNCKDVLKKIIEENGIKKELLELEITETVNDQQISKKAYELKEKGFKLLMDDFGSGYSSLNILLETPFDVVKLDKKFIENMMVSDKGKLILEQVVTMADRLGLGLLAEGVETEEQVDVLRRIGCDLVQGYYYAKPMPVEDFFALLQG